MSKILDYLIDHWWTWIPIFIASFIVALWLCAILLFLSGVL